MALSQDEVFQLELIINGCDEKHDELNDFESSFIESMKERYALYKDNTFISPKQWNVLNNLYNKVMA